MANRPTVPGPSGIMLEQIIKGDKHSHGGYVLEGFEQTTWHGIPIAGKGHKVYCPKCKPHYFVITEGCESNRVNGIARAYHGAMTSCGAVLIAESHTPVIANQQEMGAFDPITNTFYSDDDFEWACVLKTQDSLISEYRYRVDDGESKLIESGFSPSGETIKFPVSKTPHIVVWIEK